MKPVEIMAESEIDLYLPIPTYNPIA